MDIVGILLGFGLGTAVTSAIFILIRSAKKHQVPIVGVFSISEEGRMVMRFTKRIPDFMDCDYVRMRISESIPHAFREEINDYNGN